MSLRIFRGSEAQAQKTPAEGAILGWSAVLMLVVLLLALRVAPRPVRPLLLKIARTWVSGLVCFFAGVHRGASFYAPDGPLLSDPIIFLSMHFTGLSLTIAPEKTAWRVAPFAMLATLASDLFLAKRNRLPHFFLRLRPIQLLAASSLIALIGREAEYRNDQS